MDSPDPIDVIQAVADYYHINISELIAGGRLVGTPSTVRAYAICACIEIAGATYREIADEFGIAASTAALIHQEWENDPETKLCASKARLMLVIDNTQEAE